MYNASFNDVLELLLWILFIYYGLKLFFKFFGASILRYILKKVGEKFEKNFHQASGEQQQTRNEKVGHTTIDKNPSRPQKKTNKDTGEYIDYEEID